MLYSHHKNKMATAITGPPKGLEIIKATYGIPSLLVDVTKQTQEMVKNNRKIEFIKKDLVPLINKLPIG